jgi:excisionase family DNA binding protein
VLTVNSETQTATTDWLTVPEAAKQLRTGRRSVYNAIRTGALRAVPVNERGDLRIARAWLQDWCERRSVRVPAVA